MTDRCAASLTRRAFLRQGACGLATVYTLGTAHAGPRSAGKAEGKAPFRVLYNNDSTNLVGCVSPWHRQGEPLSDRALVASIDEVAGQGVDCYLLSPGLGWIPWWKSAAYPDHYEWWTKKTGLQPDTYGQYMLQGGDVVRTLVARCRELGLAPFVTFRLNDCHLQEHYGEKNAASIFVSRFYEEHPEYMLNPRHKETKDYSGTRGQNWAVPEVRAYKLALIRELCENYDLAGLELDFLRDDHLFRSTETTEDERIKIITGFVRDVRAALDRGSRSRRYLCVRIPLQLSRHGASGLSVPRLVDAGTDMFNLSGWYHTTQRTDLPQVRALAPDAALYLELTHSTGNHPYWHKEQLYGTSAWPRTSDAQFYTTAHLAYERGADGLSFFNFVYYRDHAVAPTREPPFQVLARMTNREWLAEQSQDYFLAQGCYYSQLPVQLAQGKAHILEMDLAPPKRPRSASARLRVHTAAPLAGARVHVAVNDTSLEPTADVSAFYGNPYDGMISPPDCRLAWSCPTACLKDGLNHLALQCDSPQGIRVIFVDLAVS